MADFFSDINIKKEQENAKNIHINPNTMESGINRSQFKVWREQYWKNRAKDFISEDK